MRFCEAKWAFCELPSNFSGESPERSAGDLPSPAKSLAAPSLFAYKCAHDVTACYQLFADKGKGVAVSFNLRLVFLVGYYVSAPKIGRHRKVSADFYFLLLTSSLFTLCFSLHRSGRVLPVPWSRLPARALVASGDRSAPTEAGAETGSQQSATGARSPPPAPIL